jgi:hypothetical protein
MMDEIINRYKGQPTKEGHRLQAVRELGKVMIGFLHWGEYEGSDEHHHIYIASIAEENGAYDVGWFRGNENRPFDVSEYANLAEVFVALDDAVARRSKEVGTGGP